MVAFGTKLHYPEDVMGYFSFLWHFPGVKRGRATYHHLCSNDAPAGRWRLLARLKNSHHGAVRSSATDLQPFTGQTRGQHAGGRGVVRGAPRQPSVQRHGHAGQFSRTWNWVPGTWNLLEPEGQEQSQEGSCSSLRQVS